MHIVDLWALLSGLVGAGFNGVVTKFAGRRIVAQPVGVSIASERTLLGAVLAHDPWFELVSILEPGEFYDARHQELWSALTSAHREARAIVVPVGLEDLTRELTALGESEHVTRRQLLKAGYRVMDAVDDRGWLAGSGRIDQVNDALAPLVRVYETPRRSTRLWTGAGLALSCGLSVYYVAQLRLNAFDSVLAFAALFFLGVVGSVLSLVDFVTFNIDLPVFWWGSGITWLLGALLALSTHHASHLVDGVVVVILGVALFEIPNQVYRLWRGHLGIGFGDSLLLLLTAGLPTLVTGSIMLGLYSIFFAALGAVLVFLYRWLRGVVGLGPKISRRTPSAFGPLLLFGWLPAWGWALHTGVVGLHG